jgi:Chlorophyll A-B binding protein
MKLAIAALLASSACAFSPVANKASSPSALMASSPYENELGVIQPTGFFDPLGLSTNIDAATFDQYRAAELKHGRVAQLAVIGYVTQEVYRFPFDIAPGLPCSEVPNGVAAIDAIPALGWAQMFFFIGAVDYYGVLGNFDAGKKYVGGDAKADELKLKELQNGRLAMLAILELLRHDSQNFVSPGFDGLDKLITGLPFIYE